MESKIFLYGGIYNWTVQDTLQRMEEIGADKDITYRLNSGGGDVFAAQGWLKDLKQRTGKNIGSIEGNASSMAFMLSLYMDKVTALETSTALIHRAFMYVESEEDRKMLNDINEGFKTVMKAKLNVEALEARIEMSLDEFFDAGEDNQTRREAWLSAKDLVAIGLVKEEDVLKITPEIAAALESPSAFFDDYRKKEVEKTPTDKKTQPEEKKEDSNISNNKNNTEMDAKEIEKVKADAITEEKNRTEAWLVFHDVDAKKVREGIESGKSITAKEQNEFLLAAQDKKILAQIEEKSNPNAETPKDESDAKEKEYKQAEKELHASLKLKNLED
ncbi:MAG: ATP-dependent Clp protease proteolytic subunit [Prolixibacteraceae bacterium]|jgi:ATP-dependent protease ClpP protease subunit|nr:ATP-dependent Clp protease proteolytic subunit [Prolixibacteraceae bacterium]